MNLPSFVKILVIYIYLQNVFFQSESTRSNVKNLCKFTFTTLQTIVNCRGLGLSKLPSGIPKNATKLDLSENEFSDFNNTALRQFASLHIIMLNRNKLTRIPMFPATIKIIYLSENEIAHVENDPLLQYHRLEKIDLDRNKLTRIPKFPENIKSISIRNNQLEFIEPYTFVELKCVKLINLQNNIFRKLPLNSFAMSTTCYQLRIFTGSKLLSEIESGAFKNVPNYAEISIRNTNITKIPARMIQGTRLLYKLELFSNKINYIDPDAFKGLGKVLMLYLNDNMLTRFPVALFNLSIVNKLDLSWNNISSLGVGPVLRHSPYQIYLVRNQIQNITKDNFKGLTNLTAIILLRNKITNIADGAFRDTKLKSLLLQSNFLGRITNKTLYMKSSKLDYLYVYDNPIQEIEDNSLSFMALNSRIYIDCGNLKQLPILSGGKNTYCVTETTDITFDSDLLQRTMGANKLYGMDCDDADKCTLCKQGYYGDIADYSQSCYACPPGGFYQDIVGYVDYGDYTTNCKSCPVGSFSPSAGARFVADCQTCPQGTKTDSLATLNACECLDNFHRTDRYGPCQPCPVGVDCTDGVQRLIQGYWWDWSAMGTAGNLTAYENFVNDMMDFQFEKRDPDKLKSTKYVGQLPAVHTCLRNKSCLGKGINGDCSKGYSGWLCAACNHNYYELFNECYQCQNIAVIIAIFVGIIVVLSIVGYIVWKLSRSVERQASVTSFLTHLKITINFYQILGILSEINEIHWPSDFQSVGQSLQYLDIIRYVNILSPKCIFPGTWNAYTLLYIAIATPFAIVMLTSIIFCLQKLFYQCKGSHSVHNVKDKFLSITMMMLYLTYANTCSNIMAVGPWSIRKFHVTANGSKDVSILTSDYSIHVEQGDGAVYNFHKNIVYYSLIYVVCFPLIVLLVLKSKYKRNNVDSNVGFGQSENIGLMIFLKQYRNKFWYWEVFEIYNKAVLALIANFKDDQASNMSYSLFVTVILIALHLYLQPMKNKSDQRFKLLTLCFIVVNLSVGAIVDLDTMLYTEDNTITFLHNITPVVLMLINFSILFLLIVDLLKKLKQDIWESLKHYSASNNTTEMESDNNCDLMSLTYHDAASYEDRELLNIILEQST